MGYYVRGAIDVTVTPDVLHVMALSTDDIKSIASNGGTNVFDMLADALGADDAERHREQDGTEIWSFYLTGKWLDQRDALKWAARCGAGILGEMVGDDDYLWAYNTPVGGGRLVEEDQMRTAVSWVKRMKRVEGWVVEHGVAGLPADLAALLNGG